MGGVRSSSYKWLSLTVPRADSLWVGGHSAWFTPTVQFTPAVLVSTWLSVSLRGTWPGLGDPSYGHPM